MLTWAPADLGLGGPGILPLDFSKMSSPNAPLGGSFPVVTGHS